MVVVAGVAQDEHGRLGPDLLAPLLPEHLEGVAVVGVAVDPDHVGLGVDPVHGLADVLDALEEAGHLVDAVDEDERADLRELALDGVDELQGEAGERRHRPGDVGDHEDLGLVRARVLELGLGGHTPVGQRAAHGGAEVEGALATVAALAGQAHGQLAGQRVDGLAQADHLLPGGVHEVDVLGQRLAQRLGHGLDAAVGHQATADLRLDLLLELIDAVLVLVVLEAVLERRERLGGGLAGLRTRRSSTASRSRFRSVRYR